MLFWILAYVGGLLTILSPCILPVLPFVFARANQPFRKSGLPLLLGMAITFAAFSALTVIGGDFVIHANQWGRTLALIMLVIFAFTLIFPDFAEKITLPLTRLGGALHPTLAKDLSIRKSVLLGIATGLLWAPCAGPILGLILTGAAIRGASVGTWSFLLAYALGAATSLGLALLTGGKLSKIFKRYLTAERWVRKITGIAVLLGVAAIIFGWDRKLLTKVSRVQTDSIEQNLIRQLTPSEEIKTPQGSEGVFPMLNSSPWINSQALSPSSLKGKVVVVDFWTYSCINCLRSLPYVKAWAEKYKESGLVVIGVHTPEFAFEKEISNVTKAVKDLGVTYPVVVDNDYIIWKAFHNNYWPAHYFIDGLGQIRHHHFGEGNYVESEMIIQDLLSELNPKNIKKTIQGVGGGALASQLADVKSPETYIGRARAKNQIENAQNVQNNLSLNKWGLIGKWTIQDEFATLKKANGKIFFRFHARDLHLVLGSSSGVPIPFKVTLDGAAPGDDHGFDTDESGQGTIKDHKLYQMIRQNKKAPFQDRTFEIEFLAPDVQAFAFTFG